MTSMGTYFLAVIFTGECRATLVEPDNCARVWDNSVNSQPTRQ